MDQKIFNERIVMSLLQQCAWVWKHCTTNQHEGEFSLYEVLQGQGRNSLKSKPGLVIVDEDLCKHWDVFNKTQPIDGLEFDSERFMSRMTFRKDDGHDFSFSFPIGLAFDVTRQFCISNACQALMGKAVFGYKGKERYARLPKMQAVRRPAPKPKAAKAAVPQEKKRDMAAIISMAAARLKSA